ncbi:hypothetical protein Bca4012_060712 [Brassica carinata]
MAMVTNDEGTLLNNVKPFKTTWKVEVKVLHSWTQHSNYPGGDSLDFILADKMGFKIHLTCKRVLNARVRKLQVGQWRFLENFSVYPATGKYRPTSNKFKISVIGNTNVFNSSVKNADDFLSLTPFQSIINGSLDSNFLIDVIGQAIDVGDIEVVQVLGKEKKKLELTLSDSGDQIACCLWGRFAEQVFSAYKDSEENNILCLVRFAKINVYKGQVSITNAFETSSVVINPEGFDLEDYLRLPTNELALSTVTREVVKPRGNKRQIDKWSLYPERSVLDVIMATEVEKCIVTATIHAVDTDWAWYYFGCVKCNFKKVTDVTRRDVVPVKHLWRCDACNQSVTNVAPQFKLHLLIKDDYGEAKFLLLDTIAEPILGVSAAVLLDGSLDEIEDPEDIPDPINALIGKTFKFGVYVNKDNVDYGSDIYTIGKIWGANDIITEDDDTVTNAVSSDRSSGPVCKIYIVLISIESDDNTYLSSTPLSKRRVESDMDDLSSTSKKQCSKIIKLEKNNA